MGSFSLWSRIVFFILLALCPKLLAIKAQVPSAGIKIGNKTMSTVGRSACGATDKAEVVLPNSVTSAYSNFVAVKTWGAKGKEPPSCQPNPTIAPGSDTQTFTKGDPTFEQSHLLPPNACIKGSTGDRGKIRYCFYAVNGPTHELVAETVYSYNSETVKLDKIGEITVIDPETVRFSVTFSGESSTAEAEVCFGKTSDGDIDADKQRCPDNFKLEKHGLPEITLTGLEKRAEYAIKVRLVDGGDIGDWTPSEKVEVVMTLGPLAVYDGHGGDFEYSLCNHFSPSTYGWLGLLLMMLSPLFRRRRTFFRTLFLPVVFLSATLVPSSIKAESGDLNVGILGSPYRPDLDNETAKGGASVFPFYRTIFKNKVTPFMGAEFDWNLFNGPISMQLGFGLGYTFAKGFGLKESASGAIDLNNRSKTSNISLHMYQLRPQVTLLFDGLKDYFPIFPYIRGALVGHGFSFRENGKAAKKTTTNGIAHHPNGFRFGFQTGIGLMMMLDFLDPSAVGSARAGKLFHHVYLKSELAYSQITTFGRPGYNFSSKDIMGTSYPLLWTFGLVFEIPRKY